jgi:hypothetical protein
VSEIIILGASLVLDSKSVFVICYHSRRAEIQPCQKSRIEASSARKSALSTEKLKISLSELGFEAIFDSVEKPH